MTSAEWAVKIFNKTTQPSEETEQLYGYFMLSMINCERAGEGEIYPNSCIFFNLNERINRRGFCPHWTHSHTRSVREQRSYLAFLRS